MDNITTRNVVIFYVNNGSSSHIDNPRNKCLVLGKGLTEDINGSVGTAEKKFSITFRKANTKFCLTLHYNGDESCFYVNETEIYKCKLKDNISWYNFCLGSIDFPKKDEQIEIFLNGTVYDFSVDHILI